MATSSIHVRNISYNSTGEDLGKAFGKFGRVTNARIISYVDRGERLSRGFGFVDFEVPANATAAIESTDPIVLDRRTLIVRAARPPVVRKRDTLFLAGIPEGTTKEEITAAFATYNPIDVRIIRQNSVEQRGFAFVQFDTEEHQKAAHDASRTVEIHGAESRVQWARPPGRRPGFRRRPIGPVRAARAPPADADAGAAARPPQAPQRQPGLGRRRGRGPRSGASGGRAPADSTEKPA
jgi:RNA recognition motif-containing protein